MAETVKLPGVGDVKREYVYVGAAVVAGIVGYAYWRRSQATAEELPADDYGDDYSSEAGGGPIIPSTGGGGGSTTDPDDLPPTTSSEWYRRAVDYLEGRGYESVMITTALGKYLARQELTDAEVDLVNAARGAIGPVPGGDYPVIRKPPGGGGQQPPPSNPPPAGGWTVPSPMTIKQVAQRHYGSSAWNARTQTLYYRNEGVIAAQGRARGWNMNKLADMPLNTGTVLVIP